MPTVTFDLCPFDNSTGYKFRDTTGRQPDNADGYPDTADLSLYVGTLTWVGSGDVQLSQQNVDVTDTNEYQLFTLEIPDGIYEVTYKVVDDQGATVGECTVIAVIDKDYSNDVNMLLAEQNRCSKCRESILKTLSEARGYVDSAIQLAKGQDIAGAHTLWARGMQIIELQTCRC